MDTVCKSATELAADLRNRRVSAVELLDATIERSEQVTAALNPFAVKLYERARKAAKAADRKLAKGAGGPLCGVPVTIKDSQWLASVPCANGARVLQDFVPDKTSAAIERLEAAGAVIFAKTTCPEFSLMGITASELYGRTSNPWNPERTPGGSSGGGAVAVATGCGSLALGGDGGGSIRIPAAFCGVVGFKPTHGFVPRDPCFPPWRTLVSYGPIARNVADARLMLATMADADDALVRQVSTPDVDGLARRVKGMKLIVSEDLGFAPIDDDVRDLFQRTLARIESAGAELIYDNPRLPSSVETWAITSAYDSWRHEQDATYRREELGETTQANLEFGAQFTESDYLTAQDRRKVIGEAYAAMFDRTGASIMLTPTVGCEAFPHGRINPEYIGTTPIELPWLDWGGFLYDANLTGMPACALPIGLGNEDLPISIQIMGRVGDDARVLNVAEKIETLIEWHHPFLNGAIAHQRPTQSSMNEETAHVTE
jgi:Asp-tRNA(Asn)/Glu-tRNA(Gln) amidotransferase A subunit family amidase